MTTKTKRDKRHREPEPPTAFSVDVLRRRAQRDPDIGAVVGEPPDVSVPSAPRGPIRA